MWSSRHTSSTQFDLYGHYDYKNLRILESCSYMNKYPKFNNFFLLLSPTHKRVEIENVESRHSFRSFEIAFSHQSGWKSFSSGFNTNTDAITIMHCAKIAPPLVSNNNIKCNILLHQLLLKYNRPTLNLSRFTSIFFIVRKLIKIFTYFSKPLKASPSITDILFSYNVSISKVSKPKKALLCIAVTFKRKFVYGTC